MTGFGKAEGFISNKKIIIQLKSLNSKQSDVIIKLPNSFREKELAYRKQLSDALGRGKIEMMLNYENQGENSNYVINEQVFNSYYRQLKDLSEKFGETQRDLISTITRMPDVIKSEEENLSENDWNEIENILGAAITELIKFRKTEGESLQTDLNQHIERILELLKAIITFEDERIVTVRNRLLKNFEEVGQSAKVDQDRFEQELIYYLEKYDISEEKVRLETHCNYFMDCMNKEDEQGKKLGFISQEIGREINTLGSKANHAEMQKLVVEMKDELEKIKEQVLNVW
tara:strand:+ start:131 stop:991 length:861 start_codon:yes stop_codon:yes gene_type:complete